MMPTKEDCTVQYQQCQQTPLNAVLALALFCATYLIPTTTLKSSSNDLLIYFWKSNFLPGAKWA